MGTEKFGVNDVKKELPIGQLVCIHNIIFIIIILQTLQYHGNLVILIIFYMFHCFSDLKGLLTQETFSRVLISFLLGAVLYFQACQLKT